MLDFAIGSEEMAIAAYEQSRRRGKAFFDKWAHILSAAAHVQGRKTLAQWVDAWNATHAGSEISVGSLYRMRQRVADEGWPSILAGIQAQTPSTISDHWFGYYREIYLSQAGISSPMARALALGRARREGEDVSDDAFPSHWSFMRRLKGEVSPSLLIRARKGEKAFNDAHGYGVLRDYESLPVGACWVGDTHTWDVFVSVPGQAAPATAYITAFLDFRSYLPMGWHVHVSAPSTDNTLRAIRAGIDEYGLPDDVYVDNGREYRNRDFSGITRGTRIDFDAQYHESLAARLGFRMRFAIVRNAQAKIIERQFRVMKDTFSRLFPSFKGGSVAEKPERLKATLKAGDMPTFDELRTMVDHYLKEVYPALPCQGAHHHGLTRAGLWNRYIGERPKRAVSAETSSMLVTRTFQGKVRGNGFRLTPLDCWYWAEWMPVHKGAPITLRYDPENLSVAWGYEQSGEIIGEAHLRTAVGALVSDDDTVSKEHLGAEISERRRERRLMRELFPDANPRKAQELLADLTAGLGARPIDVGRTQVQLTRHDVDASLLQREKQSGRADYARFAGDAAESTPARELRWHDDQPLAAQA